MKKKILILCHSNIGISPRVIKQINAVKNKYLIITAGYKESMDKEVSFVDLSSIQNLRYKTKYTFHYNYPFFIKKTISFFIKYFILFEFNKHIKFRNNYWDKSKKEEYNILKAISFDLIISHHLHSLPLSLKLAKIKKAPVILNAHEYYPREFEDNANWVKNMQPVNLYYCKKLLPKVNNMFCVNEGIRQEYLNQFGVDSVVIPNDKKFYDNLYPSEIEPNKITLVHHGGAIRERKIEEMINMMNYLPDNYELVFILLPTNQEYFENIKLLVSNNQRIKFKDPVDVDLIPEYINKFDIGVYILSNDTFNHEYALPNKIFEFLQARLCLAVSPNKEMKSIVEKYDLGIVSRDFTAKNMAEIILSLSPEKIRFHKEQCHKYAFELSSHKTEKLILNEVDKLIG